MRKLYVLFLLLTFGSLAVNAQLISPSDGGFENATSTFPANGWIKDASAAARQWQVGTAASSVAGGTKSAYAGAAANYNGNAAGGVFHFYRDIAIPTGATNVLLNYYYRMPINDPTYDFFKVYTTTPANTPVAGTTPGTGYTQVYSNTNTAYAAFTLMPTVNLTSFAGSTVRIVFTYISDGVAPIANPAVDNITVTYTPGTPCTTPTSIAASATATAANSTTINGSFTAAPPTVPSGYLVVRSTVNTLPTLTAGTTYSVGANGTIATNGYVEYVGAAAGSWASTGLTGGVTYYYFVFSYNNTACAGGPVYSATAQTANALTPVAPVVTLNSFYVAGTTTAGASTQCSAVGRDVSVNVTTTSGTVSGATITYAFNGISQGTFAMADAGGGNFTYTIPPATPVNATVTWSVTASNSTGGTATYIGTAYSDAPLGSTTATATASAAAFCSGSPFNLFATNSAMLNVFEGFEGASFPPTGWTLVNAGTGNNWVRSTSFASPRTGTYALNYSYNVTNAANAYIFTPAQSFFAGATYTLTFWYVGSGATFPEKLKVSVGNAATVAAQTTVLFTNANVTNTAYTQVTVTYTPTVTGSYYFAFNCFSAPDEFYLGIDDVSITGGPALTYSWTSSPAGFTSTAQNPTNVTATTTTTYYVTATQTSSGCGVTSPGVTVAIVPPLSGIYSVGAGNISGEAGHYNTLTAAVAAYNSICLGGAVTFALTDANYSTNETFPIIINSKPDASAANTLTIKPAASVVSTISGSNAVGLIKLDGADYIRIDGSNSGGTDRSLTITNSNTTALSTIVWLSSPTATDGATNNTIKNCIIRGQATTTTLGGVVSGGVTAVSAALTSNSANTIQNNLITTVQEGILVYGVAAMDNGWTISDNSIGTVAQPVGFDGILLFNMQNYQVTGNSILGVTLAANPFVAGIDLGFAHSNGLISKNKIDAIKNLTTTTTYGAYGIYLGSATAASNVEVSNNFVSNVTANGSATLTGNGYGIAAVAGGGYKIYNNAVSLTTNQATTAGGTAALLVTSGVAAAANLDIRNNIFANFQTTGAPAATRYAIYSTAASTVFGNIDYNDYFTTGTNTGFIGSNRATLAAIQTGFGGNANSFITRPNFVSATDLHLVTDNNCALNGTGITLPSVTTDIDGDVRQSPPDIGGDEFNSTFNLTITNPTAVCLGASVDLTAALVTVGSTTGTTLSYFTDPAGTIALGTPGAVVVTAPATYYIKSIKGSCTLIQAVNVTVTPAPAITVQPSPATQTLCSGSGVNTITVTATGAGLSYQWYSNTVNSSTGGTSVGAANGGQSAAYTPTATVGTTYYYVIVSGTCTPAITSNVVSVSVTAAGTWIGTTADWFDPANWCGGVPTATTDVIIPITATIFPYINNGAAVAHNVTMDPGVIVSVNGTGTFGLYGTLNSTGVFDLSAGTFILAGAGSSIGGTNIVNADIRNLSIGANSSITGGTGNMIKLSGNLTFLTSNNTFTTNDNLTLVSGPTTTASVTDMTNAGTTSGNSIIGNASVERYISAQRKWRFLSVNTEAGTGSKNTVQDNWMEGQAPGANVGPVGYGMWITDAAPATGFDASSFTPTMKWWNGSVYTGITNPTAYDIRTQPAYMTFVRGDRSATGANATTPSTVLRQFGNLTQGTTPNSTVASGSVYTTLGNPYASAIDLTKLTYSTPNIINVAVWDPNLGGSLGLGAFQYLTSPGPGQDFLIIPGGGSYAPLGFGDIMNKVESGQGYFMQGTGTARNVNFVEIAKTPKAHDVFFAPGNEQRIGGMLSIKETNGSLTLMDGILVRMKSGNNTAVDYDDVLKMVNTSVNVSVKRTNTLMAIEYRDVPDENDTVQFNMTGMRYKDYQWKFSLLNLDQPGRVGILVDRFFNSETVLNLTGDNTYDFTVNTTAGSYAPNRFFIVFRPSTVLAVKKITITANRQADGSNLIKWHAENELAIAHYELERSANGTAFTSLNVSTVPTNNNGGNAAYSQTDSRPLSSDNYYRVRAISANGTVKYSPVVKVGANTKDGMITVFPNPLTDGMLSVRFENKAAGNYTLQLFSSDGRMVYSGKVAVTGNNQLQTLALNKMLAAGNYELMIMTSGGEKEVKQVVIK